MFLIKMIARTVWVYSNSWMTLKYKEGRYKVGLLWRENKSQLLDNRAIAADRPRSLRQRLLKDENFVIGLLTR